MTSVLKRYSQIDPRMQYMVILDTSAGGHTFNITANTVSSPVMTIANFTAAYPQTVVFLAGDMVKDLGRQINVYNPSNNNVLYQIFRQVMLVSGIRYEGISSKIAYICTWDANGDTQIRLARCG